MSPHPDAPEEIYSDDPAGNRTTSERAVYEYDLADRLLSGVPYRHDANGNLVSRGGSRGSGGQIHLLR
ncbi:MAG: hypothetical protein U0Q16_28215 [Bryobacteraceae bacterium]